MCGMSEIIAWMLIAGYMISGKTELIIASGLFGIASEIYYFTNKFLKNGAEENE